MYKSLIKKIICTIFCAVAILGVQAVPIGDFSFESPVTSTYQDNTGIAPGTAIPNTSPADAWYYLGGLTGSGTPVGVQNVAANGFAAGANPDGTQDAYVNVGAWMSSAALTTIAPDTTYTLTVWEGNRGGSFPQTAGFTIALAYGSSISTGLTNSANWASSLHVPYTNAPAVGTFAPFRTTFTTGPSDASIGQSLYVMLGSDATSSNNPIDYDLVKLTASPYRGPAHTILFSPTASGVTRAITNWGLDTCWASYDNMQRGLIYMGTNNVNIVRVGFFVDAPLVNNDVSSTDKTNMQTDINLASMATAATKWDLNLDSSVSAWYQSGSGTIYPDRWAAAMEACQRYYNRDFWAAEGFNEPDYTANGEGTPQNLYDVFGYLQASTNFVGTAMEGGSTLNDDVALSTWFDAISPRATIGSTHCLAGSATSYVNFIQSVEASNAVPFNPELHNVCEAIIGANYGLQGGIWWGTAERARGDFVKACQGERLGYAEDLPNWTAAAVYRAPSGSVQAFFGGSERMATTTSYWLFSKDRPVCFDGHGPMRDYLVTIPGGTGYQANQPSMERVVNITWGSDVPPPLGGRYIIVNRNSGLALEVPGASTNNGVQLEQAVYTGAKNQQWGVYPLPNRFGGDVSYYTLVNANSGVTADVQGGSYANGAVIQQWNGGTNVWEQWNLQYTNNGYFKIRTRWCNKVMGVYGASTSSGASIVQWADTGALDQQWRLIPATVASYDFVPPAAPTGVTATANSASVQVNWNANTESDLAGYTVLRSTNSDGPYDVIARGLTNTDFIDGSANQAQPYYYVVAANDTSLNESPYSSQVSATPSGGQAMLAHYTFDNTAADSSGNGNNAQLVGAPEYTVGNSGSALMLNGAGQSVVVPPGILDRATNYTISAWVYWNGGSAWQRIFDFGTGTTQYMFLTPDSGNGTLRFAITTNGNGSEQQLNAAPLPIGQWVNVAVTYDGTTASLYTNGVLAASGAITLSPTTFNPVANFLGQSQFSGDPTLNGNLDDIYIFNYALSATQIANLSGGNPPSNGPAAPTGLSAAGGNLVVNLNWTQSTSSGITGNNVYRSTTGSGGPYNFLASLGAVTSYSDTNVTAGNTYYYSVTAVNANGESSLSAYAGATTMPASPTGLTATAGNAQVALSWSAANGASSYNVKRSTTSGGPYTTIASGVTTTSYTDSTAVNGTTYFYVVSAVNSSGESANSSEISATPSAPAAPAAPTNLSASPGHHGQVTLTWTQSSSSNIVSNNVYRATASGGPYTLVTSLSATTSYSDSHLNSGTTYYYVVTAVNSSGQESSYSNEASATAP